MNAINLDILEAEVGRPEKEGAGGLPATPGALVHAEPEIAAGTAPTPQTVTAPDDGPAPGGTASDQTDEVALAALAALSPVEFDRQAKTAAKALRVSVTTLRSEVAKRRPKNASALQGSKVNLAEVEAWPDPVDGGTVLAEAADAFSRYVALPDGAADALALWTAHAHCFDAFQCSPRLNVSSPEKGCGKTTLRDVLAVLVPRPLATENLSVAVLFRITERSKPTLLADECDTWLRDNEELRGLLNAGHRRGGQALRCEGDGNEVRAFNVFGAAVLCGIGTLPGTLHNRSILIRLERAKPGELRQRFDSRRTAHEAEVCRKVARWCADHRAELESSDPAMPPNAVNRLADNWRPLFAIAAIAGGDWPARAAAVFAKHTRNADADAQGIATMLLADVRHVFTQARTERMFSRSLVDALCGMTDRPWPEAHRGKPITETWLARRLREFGITSRTIRTHEDRAKGYDVADFTDAFARYLPAGEESKRDSVTTQAGVDKTHCSSRDTDSGCHASGTHQTPANIDLSRCHGSEPPGGAKEPAIAMLL
jgi:putative DNA primase/helicase